MQEPKIPRERAEDLVSLLVSDWRPTPRQVLWAVRIAVVLGLLVAVGYYYGITLWDWIKLLVVPAAIAAGGLWFNRQQQERALRVESQRAQDEALQAFLDQMGQMLLDEDRPLRKSKQGDEVRTLARARTLTVLARLDGARKESIIEFLYESDLIFRGRAVVDLSRADLSDADLTALYLMSADLHGVDFSGADLSWVDLNDSWLRGTYLMDATLHGTFLAGADLVMADLSNADLSEAILDDANLTDEFDVFDTKLTGVNFTNATLTGANVTYEQLRQAESLRGATMPNGQKYEEWLERPQTPEWLKKTLNMYKENRGEEWWKEWFNTYKEASKEDGENSGPS